ESVFLSNAHSTSIIYTLSLHDALPILNRISRCRPWVWLRQAAATASNSFDSDLRSSLSLRAMAMDSALSRPRTRPYRKLASTVRSEEHTSELQSRENLVCRLLLEKKKL